MPTSVPVRSTGLMDVRQLAYPPTYRPNNIIISPMSWQAILDDMGGITTVTYNSMTYPSANRVLAYPFEITESFLVYKLWWMNGTTATTDSADVGIYNEAGTSLLVSAGPTAIATANVIQEVNVTDTLLLGPARYWCAYIQGGVTATPMGIAHAAHLLRVSGCAQQAGASATLGSTFTPAVMSGTGLPLFGLAGRTQVA